MNPLNVLRGGSLMTPIGALKREDDAVLLDRAGRFRVKLNAAGAPESVLLDGYLGRLLPYQEGMDIAALPATALITAPCDMSMRVAIELRQATGHPVALVEDGKMVGVCGDEEIYAGILRQSSAAERTEEAAK
jgi:glycine betaine/proline transport system ATP-binding protein